MTGRGRFIATAAVLVDGARGRGGVVGWLVGGVHFRVGLVLCPPLLHLSYPPLLRLLDQPVLVVVPANTMTRIMVMRDRLWGTITITGTFSMYRESLKKPSQVL